MTTQLSPAEIRAAVQQLRAAVRTIGPLTRPRDPLAGLAEVQREADARYRQKLARWERDRPKREAAMRAMELAHARRRAELGAGGGPRMPLLAAAWAERPERPVMW